MLSVSWLYLVIALLLDVVATLSLKLSDGIRQRPIAVLAYILFLVSFTFFGLAMKKLEVGLVVALWAGGGLAIVAVIGMLYFQESISFSKCLFLGLVVIGVIGLSLQEMKLEP